MNRSISVVVCLLFVASGLAGCTDGPEDPVKGEDAGPEPGSVEGVVLDEAGVGVEGAQVMLLSSDRGDRTDSNGSFLIPEVPPGPVVLVASRSGYSSQTQRGELPEGGRIEVEFRLVEAPSLDPYDRTLTFEGVLSCGLVSGVDCGPAVEEENLAQHRFEVEPGLRGIVYELVWEGPAEGIAGQLRLEAAAATPGACGESYEATTGEAVLGLVLEEGFPIAGGHQCARVWPAGDPVVQQAYELHVTLFYHAPVPDGFSALQG